MHIISLCKIGLGLDLCSCSNPGGQVGSSGPRVAKFPLKCQNIINIYMYKLFIISFSLKTVISIPNSLLSQFLGLFVLDTNYHIVANCLYQIPVIRTGN